MKKILLPFLAIAVALGACNKRLDLKPSDFIDVTKAFTSVTDLEQGLLGVYSAASPGNKIYIGSILSDEVRLSSENLGQGQFSFKWQYSSTEGEHNSDYAQYYVVIDRANRVLAAMDQVPATGADVNRKARIKAELLALRGIAHYELLIRFMPSGYDANALGVAIMLKSDLTAKPARNKVGEVVTQVEADLAAARAEVNIPNAPQGDATRLSKAAIAGYQARVALLKRDWAAASTFATEAITLSGKTLATGAVYTSYWQDANESESIWQYTNNAGPQLLWRQTDGTVYFEPAQKLKASYDRTNDIRYATFFGADGADTSIVKKYPGSAIGPQINDLKHMRISELYLIRAEARAEANQLQLAADDLNAVRAARINGYTPVTFPTSAEAVAAVLLERYRELCFEGFRFFDLKRKGLGISRIAADVASPNWQNLPANDFHFALPLPLDQVLANPNSEQNPGY